VSTVEYMRTIREKYSKMGYAPYGWHEATEAPPWTPLAKPLSECRVGMMTTAGTYVAGQEAYFYKDDTSHRPIPSNTPVENLRFSHLTENYLPDARRDPNCAFPIEPLRQLVDEGVIGGLADNFSPAWARFIPNGASMRKSPRPFTRLSPRKASMSLIWFHCDPSAIRPCV